MARGNRRESIYLDGEDFARFITVLGGVCSRSNWVVHADCLMTNYYHTGVTRRKKAIQSTQTNIQEGQGFQHIINPTAIALYVTNPAVKYEIERKKAQGRSTYRFYVDAQPLSGRFGLKSVSFCNNAEHALASLRPSATKAAVVLMPRTLKAR